MKNKFKWDAYSDQPDIIRDNALKKQIYKSVRWDSLKLIITNLIFYPLVLLFYSLIPVRKKAIDTQAFFGMAINLDKSPEHIQALVDDLNVEYLLIRIPLHDIENIDQYVKFAEQFSHKNVLINILQDRRHIEDLELAKQSFKLIFERFSHLSHRFQIGNAINRKKWAIFSMGEYLDFYKVAFDLKQQQFPTLKLLGSSVIDFEYYFTLRTLFNGYKIRYDEFSSLLYVDRRGAPENTQMGFNLQSKLRFLQAILRLSPKSTSDIVITETNWPLKGTKPYAPTSDTECVSLEDQANFLVRYYCLALASGTVKQVYWHQLIAPGYGLVDNRNDELVKYPSYFAFKTLLHHLAGASFSHSENTATQYHLFFNKKGVSIEVLWSLNEITYDCGSKQIISRDGQLIEPQNLDPQNLIPKKKGMIKLGESPIYLISSNV